MSSQSLRFRDDSPGGLDSAAWPSGLRSVGYDRLAPRLEIAFRGGRLYAYFDVPEHIHYQLIEATLKGRFFRSNIRSRYRYCRLRSQPASAPSAPSCSNPIPMQPGSLSQMP